MKIITPNKELIRDIFILILVCFLVVWVWFSKGLLFAGGEEGIPFYDLNKTTNIISYTWQDTSAGYPTQLLLNRIPYFNFLNLLNLYNFPNFIIQAIHFFIIMAFGVLSIYFLLRVTLIKDLVEKQDKLFNLVPLIGAIFYLLNPFSMTQIWGRGLYLQFFPFALLPFFLLMFVLGLNKKNLIFGYIGLVISVFLGGAYGNPSYIFSQWIIISIYLLSYLIQNKKTKERVFAILYFAFVFAGWILVHMWWILPFLKITTNQFTQALGNITENVDTLKGVSKDYQLPSLVRLIHDGYFYRDEKYGASYPSFIFFLLSWLIPLAALFSYKTFRKFNNFFFFKIFFLTALFICLGANLPTGPIFIFLFQNFPFFQAFRNPFEKFGVVLTMAYAPFFAIGIIILSKKMGDFFKSKNFSFIILPVLLFLIFGVFLWPVWTGQFAGGLNFNPWVRVPAEYKSLDEWLTTQNDDGRIIHFPINPGDGLKYNGWEHSYQGIEPGEYLYTRPSIGKNGFLFKPYYNVLLQRFNNFHENTYGPDPDISKSEFRSEKLFQELAKLNVRYIIMHHDIDPELGKIGTSEPVEEYLQYEENIRKINTFGKLDVYKVEIPSNIHLIYSPDLETNYERVNPTTFLVDVEDAQKPFELYLLENFDSNWKAYVDGGEIGQHDLLYSYANKWKIEKTGSFRITVRYKPQEYVYQGTKITQLAIFGLGIICPIVTIWKLKKI